MGNLNFGIVDRLLRKPLCIPRNDRDLMLLPEITRSYLLMIGDEFEPRNAKTAFGLRDWARSACMGQLRFSREAVDLGLPDMTISEAAAAGARTLVVGIAPRGGELPDQWHTVLMEALDCGLDIASGLHQRLATLPMLADRARRNGRRIFDVRHCDMVIPVASGRKRRGKRLLTVGTDCALGKKYAALSIAAEMRNRGMAANFRATGQTGILISGSGIAIDAVVADFIAGAAELLSPDNSDDHWDIIEGQGALSHPSYGGVTLGLLHGSQPDALVLCHDPARKTLLNLPNFKVSSISDALDAYVAAARVTNPSAKFVGISLLTASISKDTAFQLMSSVSQKFGLPCVDPMRTGVKTIVNALAPTPIG